MSWAFQNTFLGFLCLKYILFIWRSLIAFWRFFLISVKNILWFRLLLPPIFFLFFFILLVVSSFIHIKYIFFRTSGWFLRYLSNTFFILIKYIFRWIWLIITLRSFFFECFLIFNFDLMFLSFYGYLDRRNINIDFLWDNDIEFFIGFITHSKDVTDLGDWSDYFLNRFLKLSCIILRCFEMICTLLSFLTITVMLINRRWKRIFEYSAYFSILLGPSHF